jgi:hypothetical protein
VSNLASGQSLEVGLIGHDGVVGMPAFPGLSTMPCDAIVQIPGLAQRISVAVMSHELVGDDKLYSIFCRFEQVLLARSMQMSLCNMFHPVEQLGVRRPTVTLVLRSLARAGFIDEARGRILLRDRSRLEAASCECYRAMRRAAAPARLSTCACSVSELSLWDAGVFC